MAKLYFYYSAMNAGKSTVLLQSSYNYRERGMDTLLLVSSIDYRYGIGKITSRIGLQSDAIQCRPDEDLFTLIESQLHQPRKQPLRCVLIDEAQFLTKHQVLDIARAVDELNIPVLTYGLRSDFQGEPFEGSKYLLIYADELEEIKTICYCGRKATMNMRIDPLGRPVLEGAQIEVGGNERYLATCRRHFQKPIPSQTLEHDDSLEPVETTTSL